MPDFLDLFHLLWPIKMQDTGRAACLGVFALDQWLCPVHAAKDEAFPVDAPDIRELEYHALDERLIVFFVRIGVQRPAHTLKQIFARADQRAGAGIRIDGVVFAFVGRQRVKGGLHVAVGPVQLFAGHDARPA